MAAFVNDIKKFTFNVIQLFFDFFITRFVENLTNRIVLKKIVMSVN